jgi:hypothetical protein
MPLSLSPEPILSTINPELLGNTITQFWNNYLYFQQLPQVGETRVISHNIGDVTNAIPPSGLTEDEILVFEHCNTGRIISAPAIYRDVVKSCMEVE